MTCHGIMCKNKCHPCVCGWKAFKQDEKYHWVMSEDNVLGIHGRFVSPLRTTLPGRQGRLWETYGMFKIN